MKLETASATPSITPSAAGDAPMLTRKRGRMAVAVSCPMSLKKLATDMAITLRLSQPRCAIGAWAAADDGSGMHVSLSNESDDEHDSKRGEQQPDADDDRSGNPVNRFVAAQPFLRFRATFGHNLGRNHL